MMRYPHDLLYLSIAQEIEILEGSIQILKRKQYYVKTVKEYDQCQLEINTHIGKIVALRQKFKTHLDFQI